MLTKKLKAIVGKENISTKNNILSKYAQDTSDHFFCPDYVIWPKSAIQISRILKLANSSGIPVTPRGAGTGTTGGCVPVKNGIVISFEKMNKIIDLNKENMTITVQPGTITYKIRQEAEKNRLFYPPDPASIKECTIGGNVAECAGGPSAVKYGVTRDYVMEMELVLPNGDIIETGAKTLKSVAGYDLVRLFSGSEGTIGIITKIMLKLIPLPEYKKTILASFKTIKQALSFINKIFSNGVTPCCLELMDEKSSHFMEIDMKQKSESKEKTLLLIELDGNKDSVLHQFSKTIKTLKTFNLNYIHTSTNTIEYERIWDARRNISKNLQKIKPHKINQDIVIPRNNMLKMFQKLKLLSKKYGLEIVTFGHAGDGNLHVNIILDKNNKKDLQKSVKCTEEIFKTAVNLEGSISGEHGIGITKAPYLKLECSNNELLVMKKIKKLFDPNNILNPGKIFLTDK